LSSLSRGKTAVKIQGPLKNAILRGILGTGGCINLIEKAAATENVLIDSHPF